MKTNFFKLMMIAFGLVLASSCQKDDVKATIASSANVKIELGSTGTTLVLDSTAAATTMATTINWGAANFGAAVSVTYTLQFDTTNFTSPVSIALGAKLMRAFTKKTLDSLVLSIGMPVGKARHVNVRVKADIGSGVAPVYSNTVALTITPYSQKPVPKYAVPDSLYIVGDATAGGWGNPVPLQGQHFTRIDDNTFGIVIQLIGGKSYLFLPLNGDWSHKYNPPGSGANPAGDFFQPDAGNNNIPGPANGGLYKIIVDFVKGKWTLTPISGLSPIPPNLYIIGDATAGAWANPVPVPSQQFKQTSNGEFQISIPLTSGKSYLFLPLNGDWSHKFGGAAATGGTLLADTAVPNSNTPAPASSGTYTIDVNFFTNTWTIK